MLNTLLLDTLLGNFLLGNYLTSAYRSLTRHKMNLVLTLVGLSIGLAATLMIALYALNESSYDEFQPDAQRTYRIVMNHLPSGKQYPMTTPRVYQHLNKVAGVEAVMPLITTKWLMDTKVKIGAEYFKLDNVMAGSSNFTDFVAIDVLHGELSLALNQPDKIALSASEAIRLFGDQNAVGQTLLFIEDNKTVEVSAVFADFADNTHYMMQSIIAAKPYLNSIGKLSHTYVKLESGADIGAIEQQTTKILKRLWKDESNDINYYFQPLLDIHLGANFNTDMKVGGSAKTVVVAISLSILLLLISSFNYINMSIAQAGIRAKEVGVRKVLGATRTQLVIQFLTESVVIALISAMLACGIVELLLPVFNQLVGRELSIGGWSNYLVEIIVVAVLIGVISGLYPAVFISSFSVNRVLSGDFGRGKTAIVIRKSLMVLQSALSVSLIIATVSLYLQLDYLQNLSVNYAKDQRINVINLPSDKIYPVGDQSLYEGLAKVEGVVSATPIDFDITNATNAGAFVSSVPGVGAFDRPIGFGGVGFNAAKTLGLELVAGRDFSAKHQSDWFNEEQSTVAILIPESVLNIAGYDNAERAIGQVWQFGAGPYQNLKGKIVGVVKDVKMGSARQTANPVLFACGIPVGGIYSLVVQVTDQYSRDIHQNITDFIKQRLNINIVETQRVTDNYQRLYKADDKLMQMIAIFSGLAVFLTCVGMFGLAAFSAQQRSQEVAIRKVLGASRLGLMALLTSESIILVGLSLMIAFPVSYYWVNDWLSNFNDAMAQSMVIYVGAAMVVALVTWVTVASIALRTASVRPQASLRYE
jgi:putative ABC transport system permease protein